jgi:hypothetical protein
MVRRLGGLRGRNHGHDPRRAALHALTYERRLAEEIAAMLPEDRDEALRVLAYIDAILNLPVGE